MRRARIEDYIRQTRDARLGQYARRVTRLASWSSVVFPPDILDSLRELVARVRHGRTVYEAWGMSQVMATSRGLTALFQGPPGTGKTLVAGVIARELGLDLYQVDLSKVMSKWIGETERNLSAIFDAAEDGQVVLLFDEADSLFAKRTEVRSSNDRYANLEVNYLLQRIDSFEGIAILTTNSGTSIDQAFKRRLSFRLSFPFPDEETRELLWRAHLPPALPIPGHARARAARPQVPALGRLHPQRVSARRVPRSAGRLRGPPASPRARRRARARRARANSPAAAPSNSHKSRAPRRYRIDENSRDPSDWWPVAGRARAPSRTRTPPRGPSHVRAAPRSSPSRARHSARTAT